MTRKETITRLENFRASLLNDSKIARRAGGRLRDTYTHIQGYKNHPDEYGNACYENSRSKTLGDVAVQIDSIIKDLKNSW